ncbi:hypothetical protein H1R20_g8754, partial [Candolleomyces eurysporus]
MLWGIKLALAVPLSFFAFATAQPATCGGNPDATTWYTNAIDNTFPKALADYTAAVDAFPSANATPEDIDVFRDCENAPMAVATLFNSTSKVQALFPQLSKIMSAVSRFEPQVLAQGRGGHWAIYQTLDLLAYNMWYVFTKCYNIWIHRRWVTALPALTYLASTGIGILILVSQSSSAVYTTALVYESAYAFLTVSTNLLITSLISFYLLNERRKFFAFLPPKELKMYTGVVAVLIESGLPLTIFGIVYAASLVVDPAKGSPEGANERYAANFVMFDIFGYLFYAFTVSNPRPYV